MDELVGLADDLRVSLLVGVPYDGLGVGAAHLGDDAGAVRLLGVARAPEHAAGRDVGEQQGQARPDARARRDHHDAPEEPRRVQQAVQRRAADPQLALLRLHDLLLRPVARVADHDAEAVDLAGLGLQVGDRRERVPLRQRLVADLDAVERAHTPVLEVQPGRVVAQLLGVDGVVSQPRPRGDRARCREDDEPEVGGAEEDVADGRVPLPGSDVRRGDVVRPEREQGSPSREPMERLEVVVVFPPQVRMGGRQDDDKHGDHDIARDDVDQGVGSAIIDIFLRREDGV